MAIRSAEASFAVWREHVDRRRAADLPGRGLPAFSGQFLKKTDAPTPPLQISRRFSLCNDDHAGERSPEKQLF
jgi:hypothetical protein